MSDAMTDARYEDPDVTEHDEFIRITSDNPMITRAKKLSEEHVKYVTDVLHVAGLDTDTIRNVSFHYRTAFVHGYKHALEDMADD